MYYNIISLKLLQLMLYAVKEWLLHRRESFFAEIRSIF